jgi:titin
MLARVRVGFAAALRAVRKSDAGVTGVEYGIMFGIFGAGMVGVTAFLVTGVTANYDSSSSNVGAAPIVCDADTEFYDVAAGLCVPRVQCDIATEWENRETNTCEEAVTCGSGFYADKANNVCIANGAPTAPRNLVATLESGPTAKLSWSAPEAPGGGTLSYKIQQATVPNATEAQWTTIATQAGTSYTTGNLTAPPNIYYYRIRASNTSTPGVDSPATDPIASVSLSGPSAPTIDSVTASVVGSTHSLSVAFTPPVYPNGLTSYQYSLNGGGWVSRTGTDFAGPPITPTITSPIVIGTGLVGNTEYLVKIRAIKVSNAGVITPGDESSAFRVRTIGTAGPPKILSITPGPTKLTVNFCAPQFDGTKDQTGCASSAVITNYKYQLTVGGTIVRAWTAVGSTAASFDITGLTNGTTYSVQLRAVNGFGDGTPSPAVTGTPGQLPAAPSITSIGKTAANLPIVLTINFNPPASTTPAITTYQYSTDSGGTWKTRSAGTTASPLTVSVASSGAALEYATLYKVRVRAVNSIGSGAASLPFDVTTSTGPPNAPVITDATSASSPVSITATFNVPTTGNPSNTITSYQYTTNNGTDVRTESTNSASGTSRTMLITRTTPGGANSLVAGTTYTIRIRALSAGGNGAWSNPYTITAGAKAAAPTITSITPGNQQLSVAFTSPTVTPAFTTFQYSTDNGTTWRNRQTGSTGSPMLITRTSNTYALLTNGTTYQIKIRGINSIGPGSPSAAVAGKPCGPPGKPRTVAASKNDLTASIDVTWLAPTYNGGCTVSGYVVERQVAGQTAWGNPIPSGSLSLSITKALGLAPVTTYSIRVAAVNLGGQGQFSAAPDPVTTGDVPTAPTNVEATVSATVKQISVDWDDSASSTVGVYKVEARSTGGWSQVGTSPTSALVVTSGLASNTAYQFRVRGANGWGDGDYSSPPAATTPPTTPSGAVTSTDPPTVLASATVKQFTVQWADFNPGSGGYVVQRTDLNGTPQGSAIAVASGTSTVIDATSFSAGNTYYYTVAGVSVWGNGSPSPRGSVTPSIPDVPAIGTSTVPATGTRRINVVWSDNPSNTSGYRVQRTNPATTATCGTTWTTATSGMPDTANPYLWTGLTSNRYYCFRVRGENAWGNSSYSSASAAAGLTK